MKIFKDGSWFDLPAFGFWVGMIISPTRVITHSWKEVASNINYKWNFLSRWNRYFLIFAIFAVFTICTFENFHFERLLDLSLIVFGLLTFYRCNEITFAFLTDSFDKTVIARHHSDFRSQRLIFLFRSFVEIVLNFSIIHYLISRFSGYTAYGASKISSIFDSLYFSVVTVTTTGYGDIAPTCFISRLACVHEILSGLVLVVVSLAVYLSVNLDSKDDRYMSDAFRRFYTSEDC